MDVDGFKIVIVKRSQSGISFVGTGYFDSTSVDSFT